MVALLALLPVGAGAQTGHHPGGAEGAGARVGAGEARPPAGRLSAANFAVTGGIQTGAHPPDDAAALRRRSSSRRCATPSSPTATSPELADGLGTTLGAAYQARAHYLDRERFTSISEAVAGRDRLRQRHHRIGFQRRQILLRQRHHGRQGRPSRTRPRRSSRGSAAPRPFGVAYGRTGRQPGRRSRSATPARSRPSPPSPRSRVPTTSTCRPTTSCTTAGRS